MFQAATALLTKKNIVAKSHEGLIMLFGREYIKTDVFDKHVFGFLTRARTERKDSSYDSFAIFDEEDAKFQLKNAEVFIRETENLI